MLTDTDLIDHAKKLVADVRHDLNDLDELDRVAVWWVATNIDTQITASQEFTDYTNHYVHLFRSGGITTAFADRARRLVKELGDV